MMSARRLFCPFAGVTIPSGFLVCDGGAYSRTEYAELFAVIGTRYGVGNGSTTFNVPNFSGRVPVGVDAGHALASAGGEETHRLTISETPAHTHAFTGASHSHSISELFRVARILPGRTSTGGMATSGLAP